MVMRPPVRGQAESVGSARASGVSMSATIAHRSAAGVHVSSPETSDFWVLAPFFLILRHTRCQANPSRNFDAALFWIPAFAGMTSCPPSGFAQDRLRRASSVRSVWETRYGPCSGSERIMRSLQISGQGALAQWTMTMNEVLLMGIVLKDSIRGSKDVNVYRTCTRTVLPGALLGSHDTSTATFCSPTALLRI